MILLHLKNPYQALQSFLIVAYYKGIIIIYLITAYYILLLCTQIRTQKFVKQVEQEKTQTVTNKNQSN